MKSIKPGRAPSAMGVWGAIVAAIFGVFWIFTAVSMGAPMMFPVFGILFVITAVITGIYHYRNATGKKRYSAFDITEDGEEPDPFNERFGEQAPYDNAQPDFVAFCPYCGTAAAANYVFCRKCGKKLNQP